MPNISITAEGKPIQQVDRMVYLGYMATEDGKCDKEIVTVCIILQFRRSIDRH